MLDKEEVIKALICSTKPYSEKEMKCENCRYRVLEEVNKELPFHPDLVIDGVEYWQSCDCDQICLDAVELLEATD